MAILSKCLFEISNQVFTSIAVVREVREFSRNVLSTQVTVKTLPCSYRYWEYFCLIIYNKIITALAIFIVGF